MKIRVAPLTEKHAARAAQLHIEGIPTGFISSLGPRFVTELYKAIAKSRHAFGFIAEDDSGQVLGFIACADDVSKLYREAIFLRGIPLLLPLLKHLLSPSTVKHILQTLLYPKKVEEKFPPAEILSVAVDARARGRGIGGRLMEAALAEIRRRKIPSVKVLVGENLEPANAYYQKWGFKLVGRIPHHGHILNIYVKEVNG